MKNFNTAEFAMVTLWAIISVFLSFNPSPFLLIAGFMFGLRFETWMRDVVQLNYEKEQSK